MPHGHRVGRAIDTGKEECEKSKVAQATGAGPHALLVIAVDATLVALQPGHDDMAPNPRHREAHRLVGYMTVIFGRRAGSRL
jgi:hypothetical protein